MTDDESIGIAARYWLLKSQPRLNENEKHYKYKLQNSSHQVMLRVGVKSTAQHNSSAISEALR